MRSEGAIAADAAREAAVASVWASLVGAGPTLSTAERHAVIRTARATWAGAPADTATSLVEEAAQLMAFDTPGVSEATVTGFEARGLDRLRWLEILGVVGRLANIDVYAVGLGATPPRLPPADGDGPTGDIAADARITDGLVPSTGPLSALQVLAALPAESASFVALHEAFYLPFDQFSNGAYEDHLSRTQIEFVAARTSYLNECFY